MRKAELTGEVYGTCSVNDKRVNSTVTMLARDRALSLYFYLIFSEVGTSHSKSTIIKSTAMLRDNKN